MEKRRLVKQPLAFILTFYMNMRVGLVVCTLWLFLMGGCVERTLSVQSDPPGALVYLNDQEIGRTPMEHDFVWYGTYDIALRMEGYESLKTKARVVAPIYEWVPLDLFAELLPIPLKDRRDLYYRLSPVTAGPEDSGPLVE